MAFRRRPPRLGAAGAATGPPASRGRNSVLRALHHAPAAKQRRVGNRQGGEDPMLSSSKLSVWRQPAASPPVAPAYTHPRLHVEAAQGVRSALASGGTNGGAMLGCGAA